jgi:hypothetical protein
MAKQSLSHAARSRTSGEAMSQVEAASHAPSRPIAEETPPPRPAEAPVRSAAPPPPSARAAEPPPVKKRRSGLFFGLVTVLGGLGVAGFYLHRIHHPLIGQLGAMVGIKLEAPSPAPAPVVSVVTVTKTVPAASAAAPEAKGDNPPAADNAATDEGSASAQGASRGAVARGGPIRGAKGKDEPKEPEKKEEPKAAAPPAPEPAAAKDKGSLAQEIEKRSQKDKDKKAEGDAEKPAAAPVKEGPLEPSTGDLSSAMARVRPAAQACLNGQTGTVTASVTFSSDGHVSSVAVSGPAAGAAGGCVKGALSGARVSAFSKPSFTISTTIRPVVRATSD